MPPNALHDQRSLFPSVNQPMKNDMSTTLPDISVDNLLDAIPNGIAVIDTDLRIVVMNQQLEALTGYALVDVKGVLADTVLRSNIANRGKTFHEIITTGEGITVEGDIINRDRRRVPMQFTLTPLRNRHDQPVGLVIVLDDLSTSHSGDSIGGGDYSDGIIGQSPKMQEVFDLIPLLAQTEASVLITGETGTGKDKVAETIHKRSARARKPFIKINCGALPESLLESELFGYVKGAFTGAVKDKPGMFRLAQGGTLFLTEIGDMPLPLQVKLLSVLDDHEFFPLGGEKKISVDVRIIAATHRSLKEQVAAGEFREDLYYRLNVLQLHLPPLRERETDTRFLLNHFLRIHSEKTGSTIKVFDSEALDLLMTYRFPGNIRELRNIVEYCVNICTGNRIEPDHLPKYLLQPGIEEPPVPPPQRVRDTSPGRSQTSIQSPPSPAKDWLTIERELIVTTMTQTRGNRSKAAGILGWGRTTLWRKLIFHGLTKSQAEDTEGGRMA